MIDLPGTDYFRCAC